MARMLMIIGAWIAFAAIVPLLTSMQRLYTPEVIPSVISTPVVKLAPLTGSTQYQNDVVARQQMVAVATNLVLLRWTGLEGLMASVAYDGKSAQLWRDAAFHRRGNGFPDVYTEKISGSGYTREMSRHNSYATAAGPIAFFYFSGSVVAVFFGMCFIAIALRLIGRLWEWMAGDRLPLATTGWYVAFVVLQLSGGLQQAVMGPLFVTSVYLGFLLLRRALSSENAEPAIVWSDASRT